MNLFALRHGIAVDLGTEGCVRDPERVLTPKGEKKTRRVAKAIKEMELSFDLLLSSPYVRARQTADIVADELGMDVELTDALIPRAEIQKLLQALESHRPAPQNVMIVGHEPHLSELVGYLLAGADRSFVTLKKSGFCKLAIRSLKPAHATLEWLLTPKQMCLMA